MKVFFSTSPRAKDMYLDDLEKIYSVLKGMNCTLTEKYIEKTSREEFYSWTSEKKEKYYKDTLSSIKKSDICLFEASFPSLGVGHLINQALKYGKPTIVLYTKGKKPFMLDLANNDKVFLYEYSVDNIKSILEEGFDYARSSADTRFNFFISPELLSYLDWYSKEKKVPRSVYLRDLISKDMLSNSEYLEDH